MNGSAAQPLAAHQGAARSALNGAKICLHLGQETGTRDCTKCNGHVRHKVFACTHPNHIETTLAECKHCADFTPVADAAHAEHVGLPTPVTAAPRGAEKRNGTTMREAPTVHTPAEAGHRLAGMLDRTAAADHGQALAQAPLAPNGLATTTLPRVPRYAQRLWAEPGLAMIGPQAPRNGKSHQLHLEPGAATKLMLKSFQCPGDIVMLTAAVRDLHLAHPGQFVTDVRTSVPALWENNPYLTPLDEGAHGVRTIDMHYDLINQCNTAPYHFVHGYVQHLEKQLGLRIPVTRFQGDVHLAAVEKERMSQVQELAFNGDFWIVMAGGKYDFTGKWWNPASYQAVVDHFRGRIQFVQCGESGHFHPPLEGVINLVGKTDARQFIRLMYHAAGVLCPVTYAMHLAAAVETKAGRPPHRACVVVSGGREPPHWEAYPQHQYISTVGALPCCTHGGCWKSRCQPVGDGDPKDTTLCERPVQVSPTLRIPQCMEMITPEDVIRRIELYYEGGTLAYLDEVRQPG